MLLNLSRELRKQILNPTGKTDQARSWNASQAAARLAGVQREVEQIYNPAVATLVPASLQKKFDEALADANRSLQDAGLLRPGEPIKGSFAVVDSRRASILVRDAVGDLGKVAQSSIDAARSVVREIHALGMDAKQVQQIIAGATISGQPKAALARIRKLAAAAVDENGKLWTVNKKTGVATAHNPRTYADGIFQQINASAANIATEERLAAKGVFYGRFIGSNSARFCTAYVGRVYYFGPGEDPFGLYPHLRTLGPRWQTYRTFHFRCTKRLVAFIPALATPAQLEAGKPTEKTKALAGLDERDAQKRFDAKPAKEPIAAAAGAAPARARSPGFSGVVQREADRVATLVTPNQVDGVRRYQSIGDRKHPGYRDVNDFYRFNSPPSRGEPWVQAVTQAMDQVLSLGRMPETTSIYRAIRDDGSILDKFYAIAGTSIPFVERGYYSSSASPSVSRDYWNDVKFKVRVDLDVPTGTPVIFPAAITGQQAEGSEIILGRDTQFEVERIEEAGDVFIVKARLIQ